MSTRYVGGTGDAMSASPMLRFLKPSQAISEAARWTCWGGGGHSPFDQTAIDGRTMAS